MYLYLLLSFLAGSNTTPLQNPVFARATTHELPILSGGNWGSSSRTADHATVAINDSHDILIAYHTTRTDITNQVSGGFAFHEPLKQVEVAFLEYDSQADDWTLEERVLIGTTEHDPLTSQYQDKVRCERPDVIAVDNRFFVVWTRRYDRNQPGYEEEPAVLECAWVEWNGSALQIYNGSQTVGRGFILDDDYKVRECAGVPDAVLLDLGDPNSSPIRLPTVGVVYPHQSDFGDAPNGGNPDDTRLCDLRLSVVSLDSSNQIPTPGNPITLVSNIVFDGPTAPAGQDAAGFILPDCAPGLQDPTTFFYRFWLAYEEQNGPVAPSTMPDGRIKLQLWEQTATGWGSPETHTFGAASSPYFRRRPNIASYPPDASGHHDVSIAFGKTNTTNNDDVVHEQWRFDLEDGFFKLPIEVGHSFDNDGDDHTRPIPLHGRTSPYVRRLYVVENESTKQLLEYDVDDDTLTVKASSTVALGRPSVAYWAGSGSTPDDVVLTWEEQESGVYYTRIWIRVD